MATHQDQKAAAWTAQDLERDRTWVFTLPQSSTSDLAAMIKEAYVPDRDLLDYTIDAFDLGTSKRVIKAAMDEAKHGRGLALLRGLPRESIEEKQFELLTWAIGLHFGVSRPQGKASHYMSAVRNAGTDYRSATGRGYSSNAKLDYHTDSADIVGLSCYNQATSGGESMVTSSLAAYDHFAAEDPRAVKYLHAPVHFSRQGEQAAGQPASYPHPVFDTRNGLRFSRWNRNRVVAGQALEGVPRIDTEHFAALERFDRLLANPGLQFKMYLQPGDLQILNSHVNLHARTDFVDHEEPALRRLLFRMWLATPDSVELPESWRPGYGEVAAGAVRGGILGQSYDERRKAFDRRQGRTVGMKQVP